MQIDKDYYKIYYRPLIEEFCKKMEPLQVPDIDRIPEPFLPLFGERYACAPVRIAIIGQDTRKWGDLNVFLRSADCWETKICDERFSEFEEHAFTGWGVQRQTFWGFVMKLLADFHGQDDWGAMKKGAMSEVLDSFAWANCNSIELYKSSARSLKIEKNLWTQIQAAGKHFDKFKHHYEVLKPDVALILHRELDMKSYFEGFSPPERVFSDNRFEQYKIEDVKTMILHLPHPQSMNRIEKTPFFFDQLKKVFEKNGQIVSFPLFLAQEEGMEALEFLKAHAPRPTPNIDKYQCLSWIADELCKRSVFMSATTLVRLLNHLGWKTDRGGSYSDKGRGPYRIIKATYDRLDRIGDTARARNVASAFRKPNFEYAYRFPGD